MGSFSGQPVFGHPDIVWRGFCKKVSQVGGLCPLDGFEVAKLGLSWYAVSVRGFKFFGFAGSFRELFPKRGEEWGSPSFEAWGWARAGSGGFYCCCKRGEGRGEQLVGLVGGWSVRGRRDLPVLEFISKAWPGDLLPGWSGFVTINKRGT